MEIQLDYHDQNEPLGALLPLKGVVVGTPSSDTARQWYLLQLDGPLEYAGVEYLHLLIASRWADHEVGAARPTSVFILLVPPAETAIPDGFSPKQYEHVAWGMATSVAPNNSFKGMPLRGTP